jgi:hypothetical protein
MGVFSGLTILFMQIEMIGHDYGSDSVSEAPIIRDMG